MKLDARIDQFDSIVESAARKEELGIDGIWSSESAHDPFIALTLAARSTNRAMVGTAIAVAFARSPMTVAASANDLQLLSDGRMVLGLGPQVRAHIKHRFSMPWSKPAARMREFVLALRAIWACWEEGGPLSFQGEFYSHTLMTPFFSPGPNPFGPPPVYITAVGPLMAEVAGEVGDGLMVHPFSTEKYLREVTIPALERGLARRPKSPRGFEITTPSFVVTGATAEEFNASSEIARQRISFYASTPNYRSVLDSHGWGDLQNELHSLSKAGRWSEMPSLIDDEVLRTFAVCGEPSTIAASIIRRYGDLCNRITLDDEVLFSEHGPEIVSALRYAPDRVGSGGEA